MNGLDINIHSDYKVSIMDLSHDLDINDMKWDFLINHLLKNSEGVYFYGLRVNYLDEDLKKSVLYLAEQGQFKEDNESNRIVFRIMLSNLILNRNLLKSLWQFYESPSIIFLSHIKNEKLLFDTLFKSISYSNLLQDVAGISMIYQGFENNVLWISSNENISNIINMV